MGDLKDNNNIKKANAWNQNTFNIFEILYLRHNVTSSFLP